MTITNMLEFVKYVKDLKKNLTYISEESPNLTEMQMDKMMELNAFCKTFGNNTPLYAIKTVIECGLFDYMLDELRRYADKYKNGQILSRSCYNYNIKLVYILTNLYTFSGKNNDDIMTLVGKKTTQLVDICTDIINPENTKISDDILWLLGNIAGDNTLH